MRRSYKKFVRRMLIKLTPCQPIERVQLHLENKNSNIENYLKNLQKMFLKRNFKTIFVCKDLTFNIFLIFIGNVIYVIFKEMSFSCMIDEHDTIVIKHFRNRIFTRRRLGS